ncbi:MAG TPA: hypothetical protein V6C81_12490 [Planktothrix sp.]
MGQSETLFSGQDFRRRGPDPADRANMFDQCYCDSGAAPGSKHDVEIKQESARAVFEEKAQKEFLANVFTQTVDGGKTLRTLLQDQVVAHLKDKQRAQYGQENLANLGDQFGAFLGKQLTRPTVSGDDVQRDMHTNVAVAEAAIECDIIQQVWSGMNKAQRHQLDAELNAKLKAARANNDNVDKSEPSANSALGRFNSNVITAVSDYLNKR